VATACPPPYTYCRLLLSAQMFRFATEAFGLSPEWMLIIMPLAGMVSALLLSWLSRPTRVGNGRRRPYKDLEAATRPGRCCQRWRQARGLERLKKEQAKSGELLRQRSLADALDTEAVAVEVAALSGQTWQITASVRTTGADLRARIAELAGIPSFEVVLMCGVDILADDEVPLLTKSDELRSPAPQLQMVRSRQQRALSGSSDGSLKFWKVSQDQLQNFATLPGHKARVNCLSVDWTRRCALSGSSDGLLKLWDLDACCCIDTLGDRESDIKCLSVDWSRRQALASDVAVLRLWDLESAVCLATLRGHGSEVYAMATDWGGMVAFSGSFEGQICIWNLQERSRIAIMHEHLACVTCVAIDTDSHQALTGSNDGLLKKWDTRRVACTMDVQGGWGDLRCLSVDWPGEQAITGSEVGILKQWDLVDGVCLRRMQGESVGLFDGINSIQLDWSTTNALTGGANGQLKFWHLGDAPCLLAVHSHGPEVRCVSIDAPEPAPRPRRDSSPSGSERHTDSDLESGLAADAPATPSSPSSPLLLLEGGSPLLVGTATASASSPCPSQPAASSLSEEMEAELRQERRRRRWMAVTVGLVVVGAVGIALRRRWRRR